MLSCKGKRRVFSDDEFVTVCILMGWAFFLDVIIALQKQLGVFLTKGKESPTSLPLKPAKS